jgi:hypothetical protein
VVKARLHKGKHMWCYQIQGRKNYWYTVYRHPVFDILWNKLIVRGLV